MNFVQEKCRRQSIRLRGYDYASCGAYFVTVCTKDRECLSGSIVDGEPRTNDVGRIVLDAWNAIPDRCPGAQIDTFVAMPNHIHGIVILVGAGLALPNPTTIPGGAASGAPTGIQGRGAACRAQEKVDIATDLKESGYGG